MNIRNSNNVHTWIPQKPQACPSCNSANYFIIEEFGCAVAGRVCARCGTTLNEPKREMTRELFESGSWVEQ
jgi:hypothetical protein